jgi:hypothetical protein
MPDRRDPDRIQHAMFEMVMARASAIACGYEDAIDLDRLRHDPLMKVAVGRCPQSGAPLASQSTISRLENAPSKTEAARLSAALVDQFGASVKPGKLEVLDIDDTFCAAHGGQQLAFWNAHHDERGFASMHIYHVASGTPVVAILRPARTPKGSWAPSNGGLPGRRMVYSGQPTCWRKRDAGIRRPPAPIGAFGSGSHSSGLPWITAPSSNTSA